MKIGDGKRDVWHLEKMCSLSCVFFVCVVVCRTVASHFFRPEQEQFSRMLNGIHSITKTFGIVHSFICLGHFLSKYLHFTFVVHYSISMYTAIHEWLFSSNFRAMHLNSIRITFCSIRIFGDRTERFYRGTGEKISKSGKWKRVK